MIDPELSRSHLNAVPVPATNSNSAFVIIDNGTYDVGFGPPGGVAPLGKRKKGK